MTTINPEDGTRSAVGEPLATLRSSVSFYRAINYSNLKKYLLFNVFSYRQWSSKIRQGKWSKKDKSPRFGIDLSLLAGENQSVNVGDPVFVSY